MAQGLLTKSNQLKLMPSTQRETNNISEFENGTYILTTNGGSIDSPNFDNRTAITNGFEYSRSGGFSLTLTAKVIDDGDAIATNDTYTYTAYGSRSSGHMTTLNGRVLGIVKVWENEAGNYWVIHGRHLNLSFGVSSATALTFDIKESDLSYRSLSETYSHYGTYLLCEVNFGDDAGGWAITRFLQVR